MRSDGVLPVLWQWKWKWREIGEPGGSGGDREGEGVPGGCAAGQVVDLAWSWVCRGGAEWRLRIGSLILGTLYSRPPEEAGIQEKDKSEKHGLRPIRKG